MSAAIEALRRSARLEGSEEISLLIGTLTEGEYDKLGALLERWRSCGTEGRPMRGEIRGCLDRADDGGRRR
jgi:hypothetical protein